MPLINNKHELALFNEYNRPEYYYLLSRRDTKFKNISGGNVRIVVVSQAKNTGFFLDSFCFLLLVPTLIEQLTILIIITHIHTLYLQDYNCLGFDNN